MVFLPFVQVFCLFSYQAHNSVLVLVLALYYLAMLELLSVLASICLGFFKQLQVFSFGLADVCCVWADQWGCFSFWFCYSASYFVELSACVFEFLVSSYCTEGENFIALLVDRRFLPNIFIFVECLIVYGKGLAEQFLNFLVIELLLSHEFVVGFVGRIDTFENCAFFFVEDPVWEKVHIVFLLRMFSRGLFLIFLIII